jgi:hypothetical protein
VLVHVPVEELHEHRDHLRGRADPALRGTEQHRNGLVPDQPLQDAVLQQRNLQPVLRRLVQDAARPGREQHQPAQPPREIGVLEHRLDGDEPAHRVSDDDAVANIEMLCHRG